MSHEFFETEMRHAFPSSWVLVADQADVANVGDYVTTTVGNEPVLIVRDGSGCINGFANVCSHRGTTLATGVGNCEGRFECPYHGWTFDPDGALQSIPGRKGFNGQLAGEELNLRALKLGIWERSIFVNIDESAPDLHSYLGAVPDLLINHGLTDLLPQISFDNVVNINWKLLVDNALDDYHLPVVHAETLQPSIEGMKLKENIYNPYSSILCMPLNDSGRGEYVSKMGLGLEQSSSTYAIDIFPNLTVIALPNGNISTFQFNPIDVSTTLVKFRSYSHGLAEGNLEEEEKFISKVLNEDYRIINRVKEGLKSRYFEPGPAHYLEGRVANFHSTLLNLLGEYCDLPELLGSDFSSDRSKLAK